MSLLERTDSLSKQGPSSLLPPPETKSWFARRKHEEAPSALGPASLLPAPSSQDRYPDPAEAQVVAVSPSELLPPPPVPARRGRRVWIGIAAALACAVAVLALTVGGKEKSSTDLMQEAIVLHGKGNHEAAVIQLKNVLARDPDHREANLLIAKAYLASGALPEAEKAFRRALEFGAPREEVVPLLVESLIAIEKHDEALKELGEGIASNASGARMALLRGRALVGSGNLVEAKTQFTIARSELPGEAMAELARVQMMEGDPDGASATLAELLANHPPSAAAFVVKGDLLRGSGDGAAALTAYRQAQALRSDYLEAALGAAITLIGQDEIGEARKELSKARAISPSSHLVAYGNALLAYREKRFEQCQEHLRQALAAAPKHMPSVLLGGAVSFATGNIELAHDAFVLYLTRFPGHLHVRKMHALTLIRKQQPQAAVSSLEPFLKFDIKDAGFFAVAGQAYLQSGDIAKARELLQKAAALNPQDPEALTDLGLVNLSGGFEDSGIAELEKAVALAPKDPRADRRLAFALMSRQRIDEALAVADRLENRLPGIADPHWIHGVAHALRKNGKQARASFERALKADPAFFPAAAALAELDRLEGKAAAARGRFEAVLKRNPKSLDAVLALAQIDADEGKLDDAIGRVQRIAAEHRDSVQAYLALARLRLRAGKVDDALSASRQAKEINARDPQVLELLGQIQLETKDAPGAVLTFTTLVNTQPRYVAGRIQLARALQAAGDRRLAIAATRDALSVAPQNAEVLGLLVSLLLADKRHEEALKVVSEVRGQRSSALAAALEGDIRMEQSDFKAALAAYRRADAIEPSNLLKVRIHQADSKLLGRDAPIDGLLALLAKSPGDLGLRLYCANVLVRLGRIEEALPLYQSALKVRPKDFRIVNNVADALLRKRDPRALDYAQQAFQLQPADPIVAATLGSALLQQGKLYEAVQILQKAITLDPDNPEIRYEFVRALVRVDDRARARTELKALLSSGKPFPQLAEARELAASLNSGTDNARR